AATTGWAPPAAARRRRDVGARGAFDGGGAFVRGRRARTQGRGGDTRRPRSGAEGATEVRQRLGARRRRGRCGRACRGVGSSPRAGVRMSRGARGAARRAGLQELEVSSQRLSSATASPLRV